jgi:hypothetical protein
MDEWLEMLLSGLSKPVDGYSKGYATDSGFILS